MSTLTQIIWKLYTPDNKKGALDTSATIGAFAGDKYDSVSQLSVILTDKEQEVEKDKLDLVVAEAKHEQEVKEMKQEFENKIKQLQKKTEHLKHHLGNADVLNKKQAEKIVIL